eukprot:NODE_6921_length_522_cov_32.054968_g6490_i0.p1 GENE.NODE_6921_length_522_cov_32.054968_g6490_i0~~NODE_6921_length_522_cov_32.054968_g6490_i0.p1  ORF type:complete len:127 (-),score=43.99 NODE_6921_length_522_cov_32.054968_g6490_i0:142-465(-)
MTAYGTVSEREVLGGTEYIPPEEEEVVEEEEGHSNGEFELNFEDTEFVGELAGMLAQQQGQHPAVLPTVFHGGYHELTPEAVLRAVAEAQENVAEPEGDEVDFDVPD